MTALRFRGNDDSFRILIRAKGAAFSAGFLQKLDFADAHCFVRRFQHIVNGQQRRANAGERFHFRARFCAQAHGDFAAQDAFFFVGKKLRLRVFQLQRMAKRNPFRRALDGAYRGDARDRQNIALFRRALAQQGERLRRHSDFAARAGDSARGFFAADIHHARGAGGIQMAEPRFFHRV